MFRYIAPAIIALACAACTAAPGPQDPAGAPPSDLARSLPALPDLPGSAPLQSPRAVSETSSDYYFSGEDWIAVSPDVYTDLSSTHFPSMPGALAWGLYQAYNGGAECTALDLMLSASSGPAYIYFANYEQLRWEPIGEFTTDPPEFSEIGLPQYYSPRGHQYFMIVTWDGGGASLLSYTCTVTQADTATHEFAPVDPDTRLELIALADGRPAFAMFDGFADQIQFSYATDTTPSTSGDWLFSLIDSGLTNVNSIAAVLYEGKPVVLYTTGSEVRVAVSSTAVPQTTDWSVQTLEDDGAYSNLEVIAGRLTAAWYESDISDDDSESFLGYARVAYPQPANLNGSWFSHRACPSDHLGARPSVTEVNGKPALAVPVIEQGVILYGTSPLEEPTTTAHWTFYEIGSAGDDDSLRLTQNGPRAVISFLNFGDVTTLLPFNDAPVDGSQWTSYFFAHNVIGDTYDHIDADGLASFGFVQEAVPGINALIIVANMQGLLDGFSNKHVWRPDTATGTEEFREISLARIGGHIAAVYVKADGPAAVVHYARGEWE